MTTLDPETLRQIEALVPDERFARERPLLVLDVDDVLLHFVGPLLRYFERNGCTLRLETFRLFGNVFEIETGVAVENARVTALLDGFFHLQTDWQTPVEGAAQAVAKIAGKAEVVLLTAMPHRHRDTRRTFLDRIGLSYPLLTTQMAKGPAIRHLRGQSGRAVAFVDDMPHNLASARVSVTDSHLFHLIADNSLRPLLPELPQDTAIAMDWREAGDGIASALRL
ncbi:MAG: hypothetical protein M9945_11300 [Aquamicrobium sp.]|uniref:hypothetical protein n=1 Tax=Aquamicrobium sp. TaxID=1872579 RepID=UPI00349EDDBD|nr:hypothetical protein [Aquamicrobium sp.]